MARPTRDVRRSAVSQGSLESGDWLLLAASALLFFAVVVNWWVSDSNFNAAQFSKAYFVVMVLLAVGTVILICYPFIQAQIGLPSLPVATPPLYLSVSVILILSTVYELGRYEGVTQPTISPGFGLYLAIVSSVLYGLGALLKWAGRERRRDAI